MKSKEVTLLLDRLGLSDTNTVFFFTQENKWRSILSSETSKKLEKIKPTAFYLFNNQPYILFFDLTEEELTTGELTESEIHKQVWSFDQSPIIFILKAGDVEIYNAFAYEKQNEKLQKIDIDQNKADEIFSFWSLQSGNTWKWLQKEYYESRKRKDLQKRVNQRLFENIKEVRFSLLDLGLSEDNANIIILRIIFIRYLIDRGIEIDNTFIKKGSVGDRRNMFYDLLASSQTLNKFFSYLNGRFNGVLFKDTSINISQKIIELLTDIFDSRKNKNQPSLFDRYFFDVFDFSIIPVEIISGIYESLMNPETKDADSAVYTPAFLVDYILNDTVDLFLNKNTTSECKIFDPSCGSGIFLVQSLRRMIDKEIELYDTNTKTKKFSNRIREIAKNNLFGVDKNREALKVTCFSVYIALLDYQHPKDIDKYEFPALLDENFFSENFFDTELPFNQYIKDRKVNFILGNPPWKNGSEDPTHVKYLKSNDYLEIIGDFQLAQSFILRSKDFADKETKCALVVTSKAIYNVNADSFRKYFLKNFILSKCFDLSPVRRLIFEDASNPAMILFFQSSENTYNLNNVVLHQSLKYNIYLKYFRALVIEKFDSKKIKQQFFYENNWMFKVALYGGTLDYMLLKKLSLNNSSLESFLSEEYGIKAGNGIHKGTPKRYFTDLIGLPIIETKDIKQYYTPIDTNKTLVKSDVYLEAGRDISLFKGKKIFFTRRPKLETEISISICEQDAVFRNSAYCIPFGNVSDSINVVYSLLISKLFTYYQYLTTSNWGIYLPEINKTEYLSIPFKQPNDQEKEILNSLVRSFLDPLKKSYSKGFTMGNVQINESLLGKINDVIESLFELNNTDKDLIDYTLKIARYQFQGEDKQKKISDFTYLDSNHYRNEILVLKNYAAIFISEFEKIYSTEYLKATIYSMDYFIAISFSFHTSKPKVAIEYLNEFSKEAQILNGIAASVSVSKIGRELYIQRDIKGFEPNSFYIIKPKEYKCWHKALAWYDVAEFKEKIQANELTSLKKQDK